MKNDIIKKYQIELNAILFATLCNFLFAILGIVFSILTNSISILFDGAYSTAMFIASCFGIFIILYIKKSKNGSNKKYLKNIFTIFKTSLVVLTSIYFFCDSIIQIVNIVNDHSNIIFVENIKYYSIYLALVIFLSLTLYLFLTLQNKKIGNHSSMIKAERKSALIDLLISAAIAISLLSSALFLPKDNYGSYIRILIDKSIVITFVTLSTPSVIKIIISEIYLMIYSKYTIQDIYQKIYNVENQKNSITNNNFLSFTYYKNKNKKRLKILLMIRNEYKESILDN